MKSISLSNFNLLVIIKSIKDFEGHIIVPVWVAIEVVEIDLLVVMVDADTNKCTCESVGQLHPQEIINSFV